MSENQRAVRKVEKGRCSETQVNKNSTFDCKLDEGSHNVHIDRKTGQRWSHRGMPGCLKKKR